MMMYQSVHSQRYGRAKGLKVKHLLQLVVLTVLFTWFLYQLNSSHKAKVLSQRAEKDSDIDDELLISDDNSGIDRIGADHDEITAGEIAQDEFIDKKSVSRSRKMLPDLMDTSELEQRIAEGDRVEAMTEDLLDDSGEGDRDERGAKLEDHVRWNDETDLETKRGEKGSVLGEGHKSLPYKRATETAEDRGDGEDEFQAEISTGEEFDSGEGWAAARNFTETVEDDTLVYTHSEDSKVKGIDVSEVKTRTNSIETKTDHKKTPDKEAELAGSKSPESSVLLLWKKSLTKSDDGAIQDLDLGDETKSGGKATQDSSEETEANKNRQNDEMTTTPSDIKSDKVALIRKGHSKEFNVPGKMNSKSPHKFKERTGDSPVPLESGADAKVEQGRRTSNTVALFGDGKEASVSKFKQDKLVQQEAIVEVVAVGKQEQPAQQEAKVEVVAVDKQKQPAQQEAKVEVVAVDKQKQPAQQEAIAEVVSAAKQHQAEGA